MSTTKPDEYIQTLIAHYLNEKGLHDTYAQFEKELNMKFNTSIIHESLDTIIHDRINFDLLDIPIDEEDALNLNDGKDHGLTLWGINIPQEKADVSLTASNSNSKTQPLVISCAAWHLGTTSVNLLITNNNRLMFYNLDANHLMLDLGSPLPKGQIMKTISTFGDFFFICDMNGTLNVFLFDQNTNKLTNALSTGPLKLHRRLITDFKFLRVYDNKNPNLFGYFASIGWDGRVVIGRFLKTDITVSANIINEFKLPTNPTSISLSIDEESKLPILLIGRLNSTLISMFTIRENSITEICRLSLNDSQFSSYSFQPMSIINIQKNIFSIGTDHIPYMRLITIALPSVKDIVNDTKNYPVVLEQLDEQLDKISSNQENIQTIQSKIPIIRKVIVSNYNTMSPQDKYSNAVILPRHYKNGVWIVGDDGFIRGFDLATGKVTAKLKCNEGRAKCASTGINKMGEYLLFCGALDKKIKLWTSTA